MRKGVVATAGVRLMAGSRSPPRAEKCPGRMSRGRGVVPIHTRREPNDAS